MISYLQVTRKSANMPRIGNLLLLLVLFIVKSNGFTKESYSEGDYSKISDKGTYLDSVLQTNELSERLETRDYLALNKEVDLPLEDGYKRKNDQQFGVSVINDYDNSGNQFIKEFTMFNKEERKKRQKRDVDIESNETHSENECVGSVEYCNMTKEDYVTMLNNYIYPQTYEWVLIGTHIVVFIVGLVGNALVCIAVYRNHTMRTVTNYFIVNLAVADFMVILLCLPPTVLWDVTETWFLGNVLCKLLLYFQSVSVTVSVLTLTFISVDRWYAICFPLKFKSTTGRAKTAIIIIWTIALVFNCPDLVVLETVKTVPLRFDLEYLVQCTATWSPRNELIWHILKVLFIYTIPLSLMTVAYCQIVKVLWRNNKIPGQADTLKLAPAEQTQLRSRRKASKMLVAVVIVFAVCYFPIHLLCLLRYTVDMEQTDAVTFLALVSHVLCYANSAINPLIYNFMSGKFRREFRRSFCCTPGSVQENFTTLTRVTTSKMRQPAVALNYMGQRVSHPHVCSTTFVENGYRK